MNAVKKRGEKVSKQGLEIKRRLSNKKTSDLAGKMPRENLGDKTEILESGGNNLSAINNSKYFSNQNNMSHIVNY